MADWRECRALRLRALEDAPDAFASTLERELAFPDRVWRRRLLTGYQALAFEGDALLGTATGIPDGQERRGREVVAMWVAPEARGRGVGRALIGSLIEWARAASAPALSLWVADGNEPAASTRVAASRRQASAAACGPVSPSSECVYNSPERQGLHAPCVTTLPVVRRKGWCRTCR